MLSHLRAIHKLSATASSFKMFIGLYDQKFGSPRSFYYLTPQECVNRAAKFGCLLTIKKALTEYGMTFFGRAAISALWYGHDDILTYILDTTSRSYSSKHSFIECLAHAAIIRGRPEIFTLLPGYHETKIQHLIWKIRLSSGLIQEGLTSKFLSLFGEIIMMISIQNSNIVVVHNLLDAGLPMSSELNHEILSTLFADEAR